MRIVKSMTAALCLLAISACAVIDALSGGSSLDSGVSSDAGSLDSRVQPDAGACAGAFNVVISVNGSTVPLGVNEPFAHVLLGDSVELSAAGSCATAGISSYTWQISPVDGTGLTAAPSLTSETITVYPVAIQKYSVILDVRDSAGNDHTESIFGFESHTFQPMPSIPGGDEARDVAASGEHLWVAAKTGAFRASLSDLGAGFTDVNAFSIGDTIPVELQVVHYDAMSDIVWFAHKDAQSVVWRVDLAGIPSASAVDFTSLFGVTAEVENIISLNPGIELATSAGATSSIDNASFTATYIPSPSALGAVAGGNGQRWAGGFALYDVDDAGAAIDVDGNGPGIDDRILGLAIDEVEDELWVTTDLGHVVRIDNATGSIIADYQSTNSGLPDASMRDLVIETNGRSRGDVWVATARGIARFKRDRLLWILYDTNDGLGLAINLTGITIATGSSGRRIFAASTRGVLYASP